jgi:hypothetical protein
MLFDIDIALEVTVIVQEQPYAIYTALKSTDRLLSGHLPDFCMRSFQVYTPSHF